MFILLRQSVLLIRRLFQCLSTKCHGASAASENGMRLWRSNCFISEAGPHALCPSPQRMSNNSRLHSFYFNEITFVAFTPAAFLLPLSLDIRFCTLVSTTTPSRKPMITITTITSKIAYVTQRVYREQCQEVISYLANAMRVHVWEA